MKKFSTLLFIGVFAGGCMVGPNYQRPTTESQDSYVNKSEYISEQDSILNLKWFDLFEDDVLIGLIDTALKNNYDLKIAIARVEQSRALYGFSKADLFPAIGYGVQGGTTNLSDNTFLGEIPAQSNYQLLGNVSWEIDVWGKIRRSNRAAYNELLASMEGQKAVQSTLVSDVASLYFQLRDFDNRLEISRSTLISRQEYYHKMNERFNGGDISELDLLQSEQQLREAEASIPFFERQVAFIAHALNVLLGKSTSPVSRGLTNLEQPEPPIIPAGLPSTLLSQRPDLRQAEYLFMAEVERIGVSQALRFPSFSLTGYLGVSSSELSNITASGSMTSSIIGSAMGPIFNFGKNKRRVDAQRKAAEAAQYQYQKTLLTALADVENSLVAIQTFRTESSARQLQLAAAERNLQLSRARYDEGYTSYLEVLIAESNLFNAALSASSVRAQELSATVTLYRSLGGGWQ